MVILGNFLLAVTKVLQIVIDVSILLIFLRSLLSCCGGSWANSGIGNFAYQATEPLLSKVRRYVPMIGMFDLSAFIVLLALVFLRQFLIGTMSYYSEVLLQGATQFS